jgi:AAA domain
MGGPGIGKTTLGRRALQSNAARNRFTETVEIRDPLTGATSVRLNDRRFFVSCVGVTTLDQFFTTVSTKSLERKRSPHEAGSLLAGFVPPSAPTLLILDNFETLTRSIESRYIDPVFEELSELSNITVVITMQGTKVPSLRICWRKFQLGPLSP